MIERLRKPAAPTILAGQDVRLESGDWLRLDEISARIVRRAKSAKWRTFVEQARHRPPQTTAQ